MTIANQPHKTPTVADVAREAGVSKAQAARALGSYGAVSEEVLSRVLAAAERLDYRPNELARSMNTGRSNTLGVIVGDIENPHFGLALRGISDVARLAGYNVILSNTDENLQAEQEAVRVLLEKQVDGIIVAPCSSREGEHLTQIVNAGRALKLFDRAVHALDVEAISADFRQSALQATTELLNAGHQRIAYVTSLNCPQPYRTPNDLGLTPVAQRVAGMEHAFALAQLSLDPSLIKTNATDERAIAQIVEELFIDSVAPTAVMASDNLIAMSLLREFAQRGLQIPQDISFVMYDDFPWTELVTPPLSVIAQPVYEMGREAARRIIAQIRGEDPGPMPAFEATFIRRHSIAANSPALEKT